VAGPTIPSTSNPFLYWKILTALVVLLPNSPSAPSGPQLILLAIKIPWRALTLAPILPFCISGNLMLQVEVVGTVGVGVVG